MPNATLQIFLKVFAQLPQRVVWKWESSYQPDIPSNVLMNAWLPQGDLLGKLINYDHHFNQSGPFYQF